MVATARTRKTAHSCCLFMLVEKRNVQFSITKSCSSAIIRYCLVAGSAEVDTRSNPHRYADGRRQLLGLSQAIREKAFQSTSPSSEAKQCNGVANSNNSKQEYHGNLKSTPAPSIEERLKSLLYSDTEGTDETKQTKDIISARDRCKNPGPYVTAYAGRDINSNEMGTRGSTRMDRISFNGDDNYVVTNHSTLQHQTNVYAYPSNHVAQSRRCASTAPPSPEDKEWNKISSPGNYQSPPPRSRAPPSPGVKTVWDGRKTPTSNHVPPNGIPRPMSTGPCSGPHLRRKSGESNKPVPALRRSLCFENEVESRSRNEAGARLVLEQSCNPANPSMRLAPQSPGQTKVKPYANQQPNFNNATPARPPKPYDSHHVINQKPPIEPHQTHHLRNTSSPPNNLRRCETPSPGHRKSANLDRSFGKDSQADVKDPRPARHTSPSQHKARHMSRDYYPQQNFSFRRAVHRSVSSDSEQCALPNDAKCQLQDKAPLSPKGDRCQRKSDDRDSGTVVEPETSVFDFDSSVLSDEDDLNNSHIMKKPMSPGRVSNQHHSPQRGDICSRSSTPILPPLSSDEEQSHLLTHQQSVLTRSPSVKQSPNVCMRNGKPENKVKPLRHVANPSLGGNAELSPTESALNEAQGRKHEQRITSKIISSKLQRGASVVRRGFHSRASSGDEKHSKKSRQRRRYDDSDVTDCSQQRPMYRLPAGRKSFHPPSYASYRTSNMINDRSEYGETSSVRSITTTSVCSSVMRKAGSRRASRRYQLEKYSKEIRSVTKRFTRLESHVVTLARSLAQLSSELRQQNITSREIEDLRHQMEELRARQLLSNEPKSRNKSMTSVVVKGGNQPKITKLVKFFGEQPPLLNLFLKQLGYEKYIKNFECESIGMMELPYMDEKRLHDIGIPLGPRLRIMKEAQKSSYV
ncbi:unnamed protein product [Clavelina lepadiformis]|uniref:SAM domain-containing protein n=2 Tax=Clavelina lepadiformis TaxID=159417 RepID=A0ABP0FKF7_CLALP